MVSRIFFLGAAARDNYFASLRKLSGLSFKALSQRLKISQRHLTDIKNGAYSLPGLIANKISDEFGLDLPDDIEVRHDYWHTKEAGKIGWKKHFELYGFIPATYESRRKGGLNSLKTHKAKNTGFFLLKEIKTPAKSIKLAELMGALAGDGGLSSRQMHLYLNLKKDKLYACILINLIIELFGVEVSQQERDNESTLVLTANSTRLVSFLNKNGLPIGNKIKQEIDVPSWIYRRKSLRKAFLRGLFDTDGCTYIDYHRYQNKTYGHICVAITSYSEKLLSSTYGLLLNLGYRPTFNNKRNILLRKENEVLRFFKEIKPHNNAHRDIVRKFMEEYRSGYNGAASKADGDESPTRVRISPPPHEYRKDYQKPKELVVKIVPNK